MQRSSVISFGISIAMSRVNSLSNNQHIEQSLNVMYIKVLITKTQQKDKEATMKNTTCFSIQMFNWDNDKQKSVIDVICVDKQVNGQCDFPQTFSTKGGVKLKDYN